MKVVKLKHPWFPHATTKWKKKPKIRENASKCCLSGYCGCCTHQVGLIIGSAILIVSALINLLAGYWIYLHMGVAAAQAFLGFLAILVALRLPKSGLITVAVIAPLVTGAGIASGVMQFLNVYALTGEFAKHYGLSLREETLEIVYCSAISTSAVLNIIAGNLVFWSDVSLLFWLDRDPTQLEGNPIQCCC